MKQLVTDCKMGISKLQTELNNGVTKTESLPSKVNKELYSFLKKSKKVTCQQLVAGRLAETLTK